MAYHNHLISNNGANTFDTRACGSSFISVLLSDYSSLDWLSARSLNFTGLAANRSILVSFSAYSGKAAIPGDSAAIKAADDRVTGQWSCNHEGCNNEGG